MRVRLVTLSLALLPSLAMAVCRPYDAHMTWLSRTYFGSGEFYYPPYVSATVVAEYAHCAASDAPNSRIDVVDLREPAVPAAVGSFLIPGTVEALALNGAYEYACVGPLGFHVLDVSDPTAPTLITTIDTPGFANAAEVAGGRLYLLDGSGGLRIYDLSNPANPGLLKTVALPGTTRDLGLYGGFVYVSAREGGLHVVDVAPVGSAFLVRTLSGYAWEVEAGAAGLFVSYANGLKAYDLSDPGNPVPVGLPAIGGERRMLLVEDHLFSTHGVIDNQLTLEALDVSVPGSLTTLDRQLVVPADSRGTALARSGDLMVAAGHGVDALSIAQLGQLEPIGLVPAASGGKQLLRRGNALYVVGPTSVQAYDLSTPETPLLVDTFARSGMGTVSLSGEVLYVPHTGGISVVSVANPLDLQHLRTVPFSGITDVAAEGALLVAGGVEPQVFIFDLSDPFVPTLIGTGPIDPCQLGVSAVALKNGLAYAAGGSNCWTNFPTLWSVIDLSVPTSPVLVGAAPVLPFTGPLDLDTPPVLLRGFEIVALQLGSEPSTHWIELASSLLRGITTGLDRRSGEIFVADGSGVHQMHLGPDSRPIVDANLVLNGADDVLVTDDALYVVSEAGLSVFEPPCPLVADAPSDPLAPSANGVALRLWPNPASRGTTSFHLALDGVHAGSELHYRWIDPSGRATRPMPLGPASSSGVYELRSAPGVGALSGARGEPRGHALGRTRSGVQFLEILDGERVVAREKVVRIR